MGLARQTFSQASLLEGESAANQTTLPPGQGLPPGEWFAIFPIPGTRWNNTYAMGTHKAHIQEPGWWRTWQVRVLGGVESPADLLPVNCPWMSDFRGSQSWLCGQLHGEQCGQLVGSCLGLEPMAKRSWGARREGVTTVQGHFYGKINRGHCADRKPWSLSCAVNEVWA